jgi:hypothetical protein
LALEQCRLDGLSAWAASRQHGPDAIERLVELMSSENERVALSAAQALLDRGFGKPQQSVDATVDGEGSGLYALLASLGRGD